MLEKRKINVLLRDENFHFFFVGSTRENRKWGYWDYDKRFNTTALLMCCLIKSSLGLLNIIKPAIQVSCQ